MDKSFSALFRHAEMHLLCSELNKMTFIQSASLVYVVKRATSRASPHVGLQVGTRAPNCETLPAENLMGSCSRGSKPTATLATREPPLG
eukprot:1284432-Amphidinium_carterae.1